MRRLEAVTEAILVVLQVVLLAFIFSFVYLSAGCGATPRVIEKPVIVPKVVKCADEAAPVWVVTPPPTVCMIGRVCYKTPDAAELADNIDKLRLWAAKITTLCGAE